MTRYRNHVASLLAISFGLVVTAPAQAASLQQVTSWGASGVPSYIAMYIYVPDTVATNPPILVVSHYCGGDAAGVFGEAQSGGIVTASNTYGFIMIFPQNHLPGSTRNCWDVGSAASLTHDGGGDTQAIAQMVKYTITKYSANANRVYATGTSSGAMMTEALLAVYPDVFKAGAEFSGVPAGCWADGYSASNQWSGNCAGGNTTNTAQGWGDKVRAMYPGYSGYRPRVQLWHGMADSTISYNNQTEAIKEWTNVLGLSTSPTSTTSVTISGHQWTRQSWQNTCGYTVLDAWGETNGPHGTDSNLNATYTIPFLGLDKTGATDPEVAQCAGGGSGTGGATSTGGTTAAGGARTGGATSTGGSRAATGGSVGTGGNVPTGGRSSAGGTSAGGGNLATGGRLGTGGNFATGGNLAIGGNFATGGESSTGGNLSTGGNPGTGGILATGGSTVAVAPGTGGAGVGTTATGGAGIVGGDGGLNGGSSSTSSDNTGSCSCRVGSNTSPGKLSALVLGAVLLLRRRRRHQATGADK